MAQASEKQEGEATVMGSARPPLPGFSAKTERWVMELIYGRRCEAEEKYLKERRENVPVTKVPLMKAKGFKATRNQTYIDIRPATPSVASNMSRRSRASFTGRSICSQPRRDLSRHASLGELKSQRAEPIQEVDERHEADAGQPEPDLTEQREPKSFVLPKYALAKYTMKHMYLAECGTRSTSMQNLRSVIKPAHNVRSTAASFFQQPGR
ncbi:hypothetical protein AK812_SmicGene20816 [Symbiodinium microadriaticum]|uniref:Uncharacterized protein n=1 Tax=Symbiodinium microadriaticum TaxID=2951 RepID=A0A1Q9DNX7_SYMMI|nr:hypothetical protein AK812_SmicGene20816 [Symbiodinium microadriaticum]CAE7331664.1 unnamed protein product [Symbiodinium microadriaticum]